jgi:hypothetical protein
VFIVYPPMWIICVRAKWEFQLELVDHNSVS